MSILSEDIKDFVYRDKTLQEWERLRNLGYDPEIEENGGWQEISANLTYGIAFAETFKELENE